MVFTGVEVNANLEVDQIKGRKRLLNNHQPSAVIGTTQHRHAMQRQCLELTLKEM